MEGRHWMLWDGECGICSECAQWVRRKDADRRFIICQFQNCPAPPMTPELYERCKYELAVITDDGRVFMGARGVLFILETLGWGWFARLLAVPPIIWPIKGGYWLVARNRSFLSRVFFKGKSCGLDNRYPDIDALN